MTDVMMSLGGFKFGIATAAYEEMSKQHSWRWAQQDRVGRKPAQQAIGPDASTLSLKGRIYPHWNGGLAQLNELKALGDEMTPQLMVDGTGRIWGKFVITKLSETQKHLNEYGQPRRQDFTLDLKEYGADA